MSRRPSTRKSPARKPATKDEAKRSGPRQRLSSAERERQIVDGAIRFFSEHGLAGQTRELAARIKVTHPLLYHYFPNKEALIRRVYKEVYLGRWKAEWEAWIEDRSQPLEERLNRFYIDYAKAILTKEWVRILIFSAFAGGYISDNYMRLLKERLLPRIVRETRAELGLAPDKPPTEAELELIWGMHGGIFYIGVRRWIYGLDFPADMNRVLTDRVRSYMTAAPEVFGRAAASP